MTRRYQLRPLNFDGESGTKIELTQLDMPSSKGSADTKDNKSNGSGDQDRGSALAATGVGDNPAGNNREVSQEAGDGGGNDTTGSSTISYQSCNSGGGGCDGGGGGDGGAGGGGSGGAGDGGGGACGGGESIKEQDGRNGGSVVHVPSTQDPNMYKRGGIHAMESRTNNEGSDDDNSSTGAPNNDTAAEATAGGTGTYGGHNLDQSTCFAVQESNHHWPS